MVKLIDYVPVDLHNVLGKGALPASIVTLLKSAYNQDANGLPNTRVKLAAFELLRLTANLSMDHGTRLRLLIHTRSNCCGDDD
jgi:hypothetical protein